MERETHQRIGSSISLNIWRTWYRYNNCVCPARKPSRDLSVWVHEDDHVAVGSDEDVTWLESKFHIRIGGSGHGRQTIQSTEQSHYFC